MAHLAQRHNNVVIKCCFLPIARFPKLMISHAEQNTYCFKCLQFCVGSLLLSLYTLLPSSAHFVTYFQIAVHSMSTLLWFFLGEGGKHKARLLCFLQLSLHLQLQQ